MVMVWQTVDMVCKQHMAMLHYNTKLLHGGWKPITRVRMLCRIICREIYYCGWVASAFEFGAGCGQMLVDIPISCGLG
jgi:hypothetical protein